MQINVLPFKFKKFISYIKTKSLKTLISRLLCYTNKRIYFTTSKYNNNWTNSIPLIKLQNADTLITRTPTLNKMPITSKNIWKKLINILNTIWRENSIKKNTYYYYNYLILHGTTRIIPINYSGLMYLHHRNGFLINSKWNA